MTDYTPCGGCGANHPRERCLNCHHDFGGSSADLPAEMFKGAARFPQGGIVSGPRLVEVPVIMSRSEPHHREAIMRMISKPKPPKDNYFMGFALHAATASKDSTKVGACLVGPAGEVRLTGYNGPAKGVQDLPERFERPTKYLFASHAEVNTIAFAAREGIATKGCTIYVTHMCCSACARTLIQAGIRRVVYGPGTTSMPREEFEAAAVMFREADVRCEELLP